MASVTYYVALAFTRSVDGGIVACEPKEARSPDQASCWPALRRAQSPLAASTSRNGRNEISVIRNNTYGVYPTTYRHLSNRFQARPPCRGQ
jgi:hypothetical protein